MKYQVALMPGDGIGPEITEATLEVLSAIQQLYPINLLTVQVDGGDLCAEKYGDPLPPETVTNIQQSQTCLKGPVGETAADVIVKLRILFDLYAGIRPIKSYPNTPALHDDVDILFVRENTEGLYKGLEFAIDSDTMVCLRVITRQASRRIAEYAFHAAHTRGKAKKVTVIHKSNVMRKTDGLFAQTCREVGTNYPNIQLEELYVDAAAMQLIKSPHDFDVIVTTNMFGDILSDEASVLIGGLGMAPGANIGDSFALFEPIHGTAPLIAGKGVANPISMILASSLMFSWLGHTYSDFHCLHASQQIETAIKTTLQQGILTQDLGGNTRTLDFGAAVAKHILAGEN
jgi:3-isopropylmalate dehydrogenase